MFTTSTHNYYLQIFAELGIIGLILYISVFLFAIQLTIKQLRKMILNNDIVSSSDILIMKISLSIQVFVVLYNMSASAMMYYPILIPYFLSITSVCILARRYKLLKSKI